MNKINKKRKNELKLPPHTWEAHPPTRHGAASRPFIIAAVSIAAIIILIILLFLGKQLVGKAFYIPETANVGTAGIVEPTATIYEDAPFTLSIGANIDLGETVAISFQLQLPDSLTCDDNINRIESLLEWDEGDLVVDTAHCEDDLITFEYATLDWSEAKSGTIDIARINFNGIANPGTYSLDFTSFNIINLANENNDFISNDGEDAVITVAPAPACISQSGQSRPCPSAVGVCASGTQACTNNAWGACSIQPATEICDQVDNDCDGSTDEGSICNTVTNCGIFGNACATGQTCTSGECVGTVAACTPTSEICDGADNDCDGSVDENNVCTTMSLTSDAFDSGEAIPPEYTCDAVSSTDVSPPLTINNIPTETRSLALVVEDLDTDLDPNVNPEIPRVHWAVYNIPVTSRTTSLNIPRAATFSATAAAPALRGILGRNEITPTINQYAPPCPPAGTTHRYRFRVYALSTTSIDSTILNDNIIRSSEFEDSIPTATLTGLYFPPAVSESGPSRGGGGFRCFSQWSCPSTWSYCNSTLQQSRTCTDTNRCDTRKLTKLDNRSCIACEESWICTPWNNCQNGQQTRTCSDEHSCGTMTQKPALQKSCQQMVETGPPPARIQPQLPPPQIQQPAVPVPSFWEQYKWFIVGIPASLLVIVLITLGVAHFLKPKPAQYNVEELREWARKEQQMGTSNEDIKDILARHTGWNKEEIENVLGAGSSSQAGK